MYVLDQKELEAIHGGFHFNVGSFIAAIAVGVITGGPVGLGIALSGIVMSEGINNLADLGDDHFREITQ